jgi:hypothetical protein
MGTSTTSKLCVSCGTNVSGQKRTKDATGNYYCADCWRSLVSGSEASHAVDATSFLDQASDQMGRKTILGIFLSGAATLLVVALAMYLILFKGAWERENKHQIESLIAAAQNYAGNDEWERAHEQYTQLFELLGDRSPSDEKLADQVKVARDEAKSIKVRVDAIINARRDAEVQRVAREEEARRIKAAQKLKEQEEAAAHKSELEQQQRWKQESTRKYVEACEPFVREIRAMTTRVDSGINYQQYIEKLGELQDEYAQIGNPPEGVEKAESFDQQANSMMRSFENAAQAWKLSIDLGRYSFELQVKRDWESAKRHAKMAISDFQSMTNDLD